MTECRYQNHKILRRRDPPVSLRLGSYQLLRKIHRLARGSSQKLNALRGGHLTFKQFPVRVCSLAHGSLMLQRQCSGQTVRICGK